MSSWQATPLDPGGLIAAFARVREIADIWIARSTARSDPRIAEIAFVTRDRMLWEPFVCALAFAGTGVEDPARALRGLPYDELVPWRDFLPDGPFLRYSGEHKTIEWPRFVDGAYVLAVSTRGEPFANSIADPVCILNCLDRGGDVDACIMRNCYGQGGYAGAPERAGAGV